MTQQITIGVTDCSKYDNYAAWLCEGQTHIETIKLTEKSWNTEDASRCQGILFTGGEDVHPRFYSKAEFLPYCDAANMNEKRDEFEIELMEYCERQKVPVLGICRGLQIYNVFAGGTLIPDIPSWGRFNHSRIGAGVDRYHTVMPDPLSWFGSQISKTVGLVNSSHHQSADKIGAGLVACALSPDGIVEALERKQPEGKSFLLLVQWHPERMKDQQSVFASGVKEVFLKAVQNI